MKRRRENRKRRRNDGGLSTGVKIAIASAVGLVAGGVAAVLIAGTDEGSKAADDVLDVVEDLRLPQPSMRMVIAEDLGEFETLDEVLCEVGAPIIESAPPGSTIDDAIGKIRLAIATELYPNFPWPPISGDHPTVGQLWTELGFLARRAVVTGTVCPEGAA